MERWKDDIESLFNTLEKKHINLYHNISKNEVQVQVDSLLTALIKLSDDQIFISLSKIIRSLKDSHTGIWAQSEFYDSYPLELFVFGDEEIRVIKAPKHHPELYGAKLLSIDNSPLQNIISEILPIIQCANNWYSERERLASYMKYAKILTLLGITQQEESARFEFLLEDGSKKNVKLYAITQADYPIAIGQSQAFKTPFNYNNSTIGIPYLWYQANEELKAAYIYFEKYPNNLQMRRFAIGISRDIIQKDLKNIIIDVRNNGGGDFYTGLELIKQLSFINQINWESGVYVLTSRKTYSAGMSNTAHFKEILNAKIVGETTGANPNDYQDGEKFQLQNSKLTVQFSKRYYRFQDTVSSGIIPDVYIKPSWKQLKKGVDSNLQWILSDIE